MAISKAKKREIEEFLRQAKESQAAIMFLTTNQAEESLTAPENTSLRQQSRQEGVSLQMVKLTFLKRNFPDLPDDITGQVFMAFASKPEEADEVTVPKVAVKLTKEGQFENKLNVLGAVVNQEFMPAEKAKKLAEVPSFEESMSMVAGALESITSQVAKGVKEVPSQVARGVSEVSQKGE